MCLYFVQQVRLIENEDKRRCLQQSLQTSERVSHVMSQSRLPDISARHEDTLNSVGVIHTTHTTHTTPEVMAAMSTVCLLGFECPGWMKLTIDVYLQTWRLASGCFMMPCGCHFSFIWMWTQSVARDGGDICQLTSRANSQIMWRLICFGMFRNMVARMFWTENQMLGACMELLSKPIDYLFVVDVHPCP